MMNGIQEAIKYAVRDISTVERAMSFCYSKNSVIQAGGCLGIFPHFLSQHFKTVYTFEPDPFNFSELCKTATNYNVIKFQAALGYERKPIELCRKRRDGKPNNHPGIVHVEGAGNIPQIRIDDLNIQDCDLIILDLEGWEIEAIAGGRKTIFHNRPVLMVEINKSVTFYGKSEDDVRSVLRLHGYKFKERIHSDEIWVPSELEP